MDRLEKLAAFDSGHTPSKMIGAGRAILLPDLWVLLVIEVS
jgi:hypothetical protein